MRQIPVILISILFSHAVFAEQALLKSAGEMCIVPDEAPIEGANYSKGDKKTEAELCGYDFHVQTSDESNQAVALCPKLFSTYPAVELLEIPNDGTKSDIEANSCNEKVGAKNKGYKKLAKYKQSMSCAKTPSIIGYYHISRVLDLDIVPVSVLRTMDKNLHLSVAEKGVAFSKGSAADLIAKNWKTLLSLITQSHPSISTDDGAYTVGALSENPRGEQKYYQDFYPGAAQEAGVIAFKKTKLFRNLGINKPVTQFIGTDLTTSNYTAIRQMKDAVDMIVLDTLFGQQDRFGNVHSVHAFMTGDGENLKKYSMKDLEKLIEKEGTDQEKKDLAKAKSMPSDWRKEVEARNAVLLKMAKSYFDRHNIPYAHAQEILIKDNDCGLKTSNVFKKHAIINSVRHISESTYIQLLRLHKKANSGELNSYLAQTLYMTEDEISQFMNGLNHVISQLTAKCTSGELYLDLNVKRHLEGQNTTPVSCATLSF